LTPLDCIVIGAGAAGLAAGRSLRNSGLRFKILEAEESPGGRAQTHVRDGFVLDGGAVFLNSSYTRTLALARQAGVAVEEVAIQPGRGGARHALLVNQSFLRYDVGTTQGFLTFPLVPLAQKLRTAAFVIKQRLRSTLQMADPKSLAAADTEDGRSWAMRTLGNDAYEYFARLAFEPFFFYETGGTSAAFMQALLGQLSSTRLLIPRGGMGALCDALARELPIERNARVAELAFEGNVLRVRHPAGVDYARTAIFAIPVHELRQFQLPLNEADRRCIDSVQYVPGIALNLGYERRGILYPPAVTPAGPGRHALVGIGEMSSWAPMHTPAGRELVQVRASCWRSEELIGKQDTQIAEQLLSDCRQVGLHIPESDWMEVVSWPNAIVRTPAGHFTATQAFVQREHNGVYFAGDWLSGSTIEGAVRSGEAAAARATARVYQTRG
jgi:protoporphyrinogen oxidase